MSRSQDTRLPRRGRTLTFLVTCHQGTELMSEAHSWLSAQSIRTFLLSCLGTATWSYEASSSIRVSLTTQDSEGGDLEPMSLGSPGSDAVYPSAIDVQTIAACDFTYWKLCVWMKIFG